MAKPRYGRNEKVKKGTGVYKRSRRRAKRQGREEVFKGGLTGREARSLVPDKPKRNKGGVQGGVRKRALSRLDYLEDHGGKPGGVRTRDGISRPEARKIRSAWMTERRHDPLRPRSGRDLVREANALTNLEYGDYENELGRQRQQEAGRQNVLFTGDNAWFKQYQQEVAAAAQRQQVAEMAFQQGANAYAQQAQLSAQGAMQQQPVGGQGPSGAGAVDPNVQAQAQQAAQARYQMAQQAAVGLAARGASNVQAVNELAIAASQQAQEGLMESQARMAKVGQLARELAVEKGQYRTGKMSELKEQERTYELSRSAFGLDVAEAKEDARHNRQQEKHNRAVLRAKKREDNRQYRQWVREYGADRADEMFNRMEKDRRYQLDVDKFGETKAQNRWDRRHGGRGGDGIADHGKYKGYSESERDKFDSAMRKLNAIERKVRKTESGKRVGGRGYVRKNKDLMIDSLVDKGIPARIAKRAVERFIRSSRSLNRGNVNARGPKGQGRRPT